MGVLPHLKKGICGTSVEAGSKAIGYAFLNLRSSAIFVLLCGVWYVLNDASSPQEGDPPDTSPIAGMEENDFILLVLTIMIAFLLILCFLDVLMLIGVYKKRSSFILLWVIVQVIVVCFGILHLIRTLTEGPASFLGYPYIIQRLIIIGCIFYCILVVNSHHQNLKSEPKSPQIS